MVIYKYRHPRNIPAKFYKPIGQIIARWPYAELYLLCIAWHYFNINDPKTARLLTWGLNASGKLKVFAALHDHPWWVKDPGEIAEIKAIFKQADSIRIKRNWLAHGLWSRRQGKDDLKLLYMTEPDDKILPGPNRAMKVSLRELQKWARDLDALNIRLKKFQTRIGAPVP